MRKICLFVYVFLFSFLSWGQTPKIKAYFTRPVNTSVSSGINAIYLNSLVDDTLIAYINRAKYTLDIAVYSFNEASGISSISAAVNSAYARGVAVRWIYDGSSSNPSLPLLDTNIKKLASPTSADYGIMHNKFMVIDANSADTTEPTVWTGSTNWTAAQIMTDANNVLIIQDKEVALAYTTEFNEMWGGTDLTPNLTNSKFGPYKTDNTQHSFMVGGIPVELYFSPTDGANAKLQQSIESANVDMYFGIYSFTVAADADLISSDIQNGVYVAGIMDPTSSSYPPYASLTPVMGANLIKDNITGLYHNKMLIVDPSAPNSDPLVFTGSFNWSASAETKNDENAVIVHNATIANVYYQSFYQNFIDEGGTLAVQSGIASEAKPSSIMLYPNPCNAFVNIKTNDASLLNYTEISLYNIVGKEMHPSISKHSDSYLIDTKTLQEGIYFLQIKTNNNIEIKKLQVIR
ncbi:MAG: phospholipase D-like domain-containing protein [Bacteroidota bacterium]